MGSAFVKRFVSLAILLVAGLVLIGAVIYRINPGVIILVAPSIQFRTPYCTRFQAMRDLAIKLRQMAASEEIRKGITLLKEEASLNLWHTPERDFWVPRDRDVLLPILLAQSHRHIYETGNVRVREGDVVLDCGAYVGTYAYHALSAGAKLVVAIEPTPVSVECLRRNLAVEIASGKAIVYPKAVSDRIGTLTLYTHGAGAGNSIVAREQGAGEITVPVNTIDEIVRELKLPRVDFIKMDVKGATEGALAGAVQTIARDRPRIAISTEEASDNPASIAALIQKLQPAYKMTCGPCLLDSRTIYTDTLFFQ